MTLGRKHMAISLACVGASLLYNVWVFTRPSTVRAASAQSAGTPQQPSLAEPLLAAAPAPLPHVTGDAPIDPLTIPAAPDVAIDRQPVWPRDPFAATALRQPEATAAPSPESPA